MVSWLSRRDGTFPALQRAICKLARWIPSGYFASRIDFAEPSSKYRKISAACQV